MTGILLRLVLMLAGLAFAAVAVLVVALLLTLWGVRALWCLVTGRPIIPFVVRMGPRGAFEEMMRRAPQPASRTPRADAAAGRRPLPDVTDVDPK